MRIYIIAVLALCFTHFTWAQNNEVKTVYVNQNISTHFIMSEPIQYVDISTKKVVGDMPLSNILRLKPLDSDHGYQDLGIVTIVGQKYMAQFKLVHSNPNKADNNIKVSSYEGISLISPEVSLTEDEMKKFSIEILNQKKSYYSVKAKGNKIESILNNLFTIGDYFFIDLTFKNKTNIKYDIDQIRFKIEDKKMVKKTNFQQTEISPEYQLYNSTEFSKIYRNIFVFRKFTFPEEKVFTVELAEEQISGRTIILSVDYSDILNADTL